MQQTFRDLMLETGAYQFSAENFELCKECSELKLTEQFIANQLFMAENADVFEADDVTLTEGYLMESADESTLQALMEKKEEKKKGILSKIKGGFKRLGKIIVKFFKTITGANYRAIKKKAKAKAKECKDLQAKVKAVTEKSEVMVVQVKDLEVELKNMENMFNSMKDAKDKQSDQLKDQKQKNADLETENKALKQKNSNQADVIAVQRKKINKQGQSISNLKNDLLAAQAALSEQATVVIKPKENGKYETAMSFSDLYDAFNILSGDASTADVRKVYNLIQNAQKKAKTSGVIITEFPNKLQELQKKLEEAIARLNMHEVTIQDSTDKTVETAAETRARHAADPSNYDECVLFEASNMSGEDTSLINKIYAMLQKSISDTMGLTSAYTNMCSSIVKGVAGSAS